MNIELPNELANNIADMIGVYGASEEHGEDCKCRICFVSKMEDRIINSMANLLNQNNQTIVDKDSLQYKQIEIVEWVKKGIDSINPCWVSCGEVYDNLLDLNSIDHITVYDNPDTACRRPFVIKFIKKTGKQIEWIFNEGARRNEVYTKIYNKIHPEEL